MRPGASGRRAGGPTATILGIAALLVLGAAAAAYAALSKSAPKPRVVVATVTPATTPTPATPPAATTLPSTPTLKTTIPRITIKPPKIPLTTVTPKLPATITTPRISVAPTTTTPSSTPTGGASSEESNPTAILLDTNAASTYNPYNYPASSFGDPSLAIDGDTSTGWTAQVDPATAPKMAVGLLIDLKGAQKVSAARTRSHRPPA